MICGGKILHPVPVEIPDRYGTRSIPYPYGRGTAEAAQTIAEADRYVDGKEICGGKILPTVPVEIPDRYGKRRIPYPHVRGTAEIARTAGRVGHGEGEGGRCSRTVTVEGLHGYGIHAGLLGVGHGDCAGDGIDRQYAGEIGIRVSHRAGGVGRRSIGAYRGILTSGDAGVGVAAEGGGRTNARHRRYRR